jgi:hypothetical protein
MPVPMDHGLALGPPVECPTELARGHVSARPQRRSDCLARRRAECRRVQGRGHVEDDFDRQRRTCDKAQRRVQQEPTRSRVSLSGHVACGAMHGVEGMAIQNFARSEARPPASFGTAPLPMASRLLLRRCGARRFLSRKVDDGTFNPCVRGRDRSWHHCAVPASTENSRDIRDGHRRRLSIARRCG